MTLRQSILCVKCFLCALSVFYWPCPGETTVLVNTFDSSYDLLVCAAPDRLYDLTCTATQKSSYASE